MSEKEKTDIDELLRQFPLITDRPSNRGWQDPKCPKCGITLGNKMSYACQHSYCPSGLN